MTKKEETRQRILHVAKDKFISVGYKDTLIIDIAKEVKIDRRTVYRHFDTKEIILLTLLTDYFDMFGKHLSEVDFSYTDNSFMKMQILFDHYSKFFLNNIEMLILAGMLDTNLSSDSRETLLYKEFIKSTQKPDELMCELLEEGIKDSSIIENINPKLYSVTINNSLLSLASRVVRQKDLLDKEQGMESWQMVTSLGDIIINGLKND